MHSSIIFSYKISNFNNSVIRVVASTAVHLIPSKYSCYTFFDERKKFDFAQVIGAFEEISSHKPRNFLWVMILNLFFAESFNKSSFFWLNTNRESISDIRVSFVFFDLKSYNQLFRKCRKWLETKYKGSKVPQETYVGLVFFHYPKAFESLNLISVGSRDKSLL